MVEPDAGKLHDAVMAEPRVANELGARYVRNRHAPFVVTNNILALTETYIEW
jgi:hypothetical protein